MYLTRLHMEFMCLYVQDFFSKKANGRSTKIRRYNVCRSRKRSGYIFKKNYII